MQQELLEEAERAWQKGEPSVAGRALFRSLLPYCWYPRAHHLLRDIARLLSLTAKLRALLDVAPGKVSREELEAALLAMKGEKESDSPEEEGARAIAMDVARIGLRSCDGLAGGDLALGESLIASLAAVCAAKGRDDLRRRWWRLAKYGEEEQVPMASEQLSYGEALTKVLAKIHPAPYPDPAPGSGPPMPMSAECVVLEEHTQEFPWGWLFFFQSRVFVETSDHAQMLVGNAPLIANRYDGQLRWTGTAYPVAHYVREYELELKNASGTGTGE